MDPLTYLIIIFICLALSAFFSASETALMRLRREKVERDVQTARGPAAISVRDLLKNTSRLLVTILLGNNIVNVVATALAAALAVHFLGEEQGVLIASIIMTATILIFGEILPKAIAAHNAKTIAYLVGLPLYLLHNLLRPLHFIFDRAIDPIVRLIGQSREDEERNRIDEILAIARSAPETKQRGNPLAIISGAASAAELTVSDIMIPRTEIVAFPAEIGATQLLNNLLEERFTRVPIYEGSLDNVLGLIHLKDLTHHVRGQQEDVRPILKPVLRVPERKPILQLLGDMQRSLIHMAMVKDEFNVTQGLVTQEDILEEIVGEIRDEFDSDELLSIRELPDGSFEALGRLLVADFNRQTNSRLKAERGDTLSGLVCNTLGRAPHKGDRITLPGYDIVVLDVSGMRVGRVQIKHQPFILH